MAATVPVVHSHKKQFHFVQTGTWPIAATGLRSVQTLMVRYELGLGQKKILHLHLGRRTHKDTRTASKQMPKVTTYE